MPQPSRRLERKLKIRHEDITGDETLITGYNPECKQQPFQQKSPSSPCPQKGNPIHSNVKSIFTVFFSTFKELCIMNLFYKYKR
jgi:hypothetical protein